MKSSQQCIAVRHAGLAVEFATRYFPLACGKTHRFRGIVGPYHSGRYLSYFRAISRSLTSFCVIRVLRLRHTPAGQTKPDVREEFCHV